jgi:hypothetical protein
VVVPYPGDPLAKKYAGMPASDFLKAVQAAETSEVTGKESSSR